jgi:hypothetical protein
MSEACLSLVPTQQTQDGPCAAAEAAYPAHAKAIYVTRLDGTFSLRWRRQVAAPIAISL